MYKPDIQLVDRNVIVPSLRTLHNWQISFMNIPSTSCSSRSWINNVFYGLEHDLRGAIFSRKIACTNWLHDRVVIPCDCRDGQWERENFIIHLLHTHLYAMMPYFSQWEHENSILHLDQFLHNLLNAPNPLKSDRQPMRAHTDSLTYLPMGVHTDRLEPNVYKNCQTPPEKSPQHKGFTWLTELIQRCPTQTTDNL